MKVTHHVPQCLLYISDLFSSSQYLYAIYVSFQNFQIIYYLGFLLHLFFTT